MHLHCGVGYPCRESSLQILKNCTTGQLTGSCWRALHHEVKNFHFRVYTFLVEGALDWRMVSTTSAGRPEAMSCAPSGATPTFSITPGGGAEWHPLLVRGDPPWWEPPKESRLGGKSGPRTILGPASTGLLTVGEHRLGVLSSELLGAERSGERRTDAASAMSVL